MKKYLFSLLSILCFWAINSQSNSTVVIRSGSGDLSEIKIKYDDNGTRHVTIVSKDSNGDTETISWDDNGEVPEDIAAQLREKNISLSDLETGRHFDFDFDFRGRATLGVELRETEGGVVIDHVLKGSSADNAGLLEGDLITAIDAEPVESVRQVTDLMRAKEPGDKIEITIVRNGRSEKVVAELQEGWGFSMLDDLPGSFHFDFGDRFDDFGEFGRNFRFEFDHDSFREQMDRLRDDLKDLHLHMPEMRHWNFGGNFERPRLGVILSEIDEGLEVDVLSSEGPAEKAGLKEGDVITEIDGKQVTAVDDVLDILDEHAAGDVVKLTYLREGKQHHVEVTLQESEIVIRSRPRIEVRPFPRVRRIRDIRRI